MLSRGFTRTLAACAATLAFTASAPAFASQGSARSAFRPAGTPWVSPRPVAPPSLVRITAYQAFTLDPNGKTGPVEGTNLNPTDDTTANAVRASQPDGAGMLIDPNG